MTSTRLPGKLLLPLAGEPVLVRMLERVRRISGLDAICVCVPHGDAQEPLVELLRPQADIVVTRGPEHDVLARFAIAARETRAQRVVRITSDCCLIDPSFSSALLEAWTRAGTPCARTAFKGGVPYGMDTEGVSAEVLLEADREATSDYDREHVTPFVWSHPERYPTTFLDHEPDRHHWRLALDTPADYAFISTVYDRLHGDRPDFAFAEMEALFRQEPELLTINPVSAGE